MAQDAVVSPDGVRSVELQRCGDVPRCKLQMIVRSTLGPPSSVRRIALPAACDDQISFTWLSTRIVEMECHINPSVGAYQEVDAVTGKMFNSALGSGFTRSPDGHHVANVGWLPHFSPPYQHSHYLEIDGKAVYPKPVRRDEELNFAKKAGSLYTDIHEFQYSWTWSPDSRLVALVDREFDWQENSTDDTDEEVNERYYLVIAGTGLTPRRVEIDATARKPELQWVGTDKLQIVESGKVRTYRLSDFSEMRQK